eukprot:m.7877 g.7877  ORF g.7877 m.7877 type:complete len:126 (-) comp5321_c0_seq1:524-901(-)
MDGGNWFYSAISAAAGLLQANGWFILGALALLFFLYKQLKPVVEKAMEDKSEVKTDEQKRLEARARQLEEYQRKVQQAEAEAREKKRQEILNPQPKPKPAAQPSYSDLDQPRYRPRPRIVRRRGG